VQLTSTNSSIGLIYALKKIFLKIELLLIINSILSTQLSTVA